MVRHNIFIRLWASVDKPSLLILFGMIAVIAAILMARALGYIY